MHNFSAMCGLSYFRAQVPTQQGMIVLKSSPLREPLNVKILQVMATGVSLRQETHFMDTLVPVCAVPEAYANHPINWADAFYVMSFGVVAATLLLLIERCIELL